MRRKSYAAFIVLVISAGLVFSCHVPLTANAGSVVWSRDGKYGGKSFVNDPTGAMKNTDGEWKGVWKQDEGGWIFRYPDGTMQTDSWKYINNNWYHFGVSGYADTNWSLIDGKWYYFDPDTCAMRRETLLQNGVRYQFDTGGAWIE